MVVLLFCKLTQLSPKASPLRSLKCKTGLLNSGESETTVPTSLFTSMMLEAHISKWMGDVEFLMLGCQSHNLSISPDNKIEQMHYRNSMRSKQPGVIFTVAGDFNQAYLRTVT